MSDRITSVRAPGVKGSNLAYPGRKTRAEMIEVYREHNRQKLREATEALSALDSELVVETYLGIYSQRDLEIVE